MERIKHLLPRVKQYFKANLHTHTTISDGKLSLEETTQAYKDMGYQILAITDHNIIVDHSNLSEPGFLMLTGVEVNYDHESYRPGFDGRVYHLNLIAKRPDNLWIPGTAPHKYPGGLAYIDKMHCEEMDMRYDPDVVNAMIAKANEMGFLVSYNHPTWSCQSYPDYAPLKGLWAVEVHNGECYHRLGCNENNARVYKDLLNLGNRLFPLGTDDMHSRECVGKGWVMVGAQELRYDSVIDALEKGDFYMSCGPEIYSLTIEGTTLRLTCSDARNVSVESHGRFCRRTVAKGENWLHEVEFDISDFITKADGDTNLYIYLTVTAPDGSYAATRAYYLDEL